MDTLALLGAVWLAGYVLVCAIWPYTRCGRCEGTGKRRSPSGKAWRPCGRCGGDGQRVRAGRWLVEWFRFGG